MVTAPGMASTPSRAVQPWKALLPINSAEVAPVTVRREVESLKVSPSMRVTPAGSRTLVSCGHSLKAPCPIVCTVSDMTTVRSVGCLANAHLPIFVALVTVSERMGV